MPGNWIYLGIALFVAVEIAIGIFVIRMIVGRLFRNLAEQYPEVTPGADSVERRFQSFKIGHMNAQSSIHIAVDTDYLHLRPTRFLRWVGARSLSIPWDAIELGARLGPFRRAKIGTVTVYGPAWALDLAEPGNT